MRLPPYKNTDVSGGLPQTATGNYATVDLAGTEADRSRRLGTTCCDMQTNGATGPAFVSSPAPIFLYLHIFNILQVMRKNRCWAHEGVEQMLGTTRSD